MKRHSLRQNSSITINNLKHANTQNTNATKSNSITNGQNTFKQSEQQYQQQSQAANQTSRASISHNEFLVGQSIQMHLLLKKSLQQSSSTSSTAQTNSEQLTATNNNNNNNNSSIFVNNLNTTNKFQNSQAPLMQLFGASIASSKKSLREMYTCSQFEEKIKSDLQKEISKLLDRKSEEKQNSSRQNKIASKRYSGKSGSQDSRKENNVINSNSISSISHGFITIDDNQANSIDTKKNNTINNNKQCQQTLTLEDQQNEHRNCNIHDGKFIGGVLLKNRKSRESLKGNNGQAHNSLVESSSKELMKGNNSNNNNNSSSRSNSLLRLSEKHPASELLELLHENSNNIDKQKQQKYKYPPNVAMTSRFHKNSQKMATRKQSLPGVIFKENHVMPLKKNKFKVLADYIRDSLSNCVELQQNNSLAGLAVENSRSISDKQRQELQTTKLNQVIKGKQEEQNGLVGDRFSDEIIEYQKKGCQCCGTGDCMDSSKIIIGGNRCCMRQFRSTSVSHRNDNQGDDDNDNIDDYPSKSFHERMFRGSKRDLLMRDYLLSDRKWQQYQAGEVIMTHTKSLDTTIYSVIEQQDESMFGGKELLENHIEEQKLVKQRKQIEQQTDKHNNNNITEKVKDMSLTLRPFQTRSYRRLSENLRSNSSLVKMPLLDRMGMISNRKSYVKQIDNNNQNEEQYQERQSDLNNEGYSNQQAIQKNNGNKSINKNNFGRHERELARRSIDIKSTLIQEQGLNQNYKSTALPILAVPSKENQIIGQNKPSEDNKNRCQQRGSSITTRKITNSPSKPRRIIIPQQNNKQQSQIEQEQCYLEQFHHGCQSRQIEYSKILQRRGNSINSKLTEYSGWEHVKGEIWPDER